MQLTNWMVWIIFTYLMYHKCFKEVSLRFFFFFKRVLFTFLHVCRSKKKSFLIFVIVILFVCGRSFSTHTDARIGSLFLSPSPFLFLSPRFMKVSYGGSHSLCCVLELNNYAAYLFLHVYLLCVKVPLVD